MQDLLATVLMPVYNGEKYLKEAVDSILKQTFKDFEFLIIDDGSTDATLKILKLYNDPRIVIHCNETNLGLVKSLNSGIKLARGKYIIRMDVDDICLPNRLEKQINFMEVNPEIGVAGSWIQTHGTKKSSIWSLPVTHNEITARMLFESPFHHPTVIMRKHLIESLKIFYNPNFKHAEDYEFWAMLTFSGVKFANIGEVLLKYRIHKSQIGAVYASTQKNNSDRVRLIILNNLGIQPDEEEFFIHRVLANTYPTNREYIKKTPIWLDKILKANEKSRFFSSSALEKELGIRWFKICNTSAVLGLYVWGEYKKNKWAKKTKLSLKQRIKFLIKCLLRINSQDELINKIERQKNENIDRCSFW